MKMKKVVKKMVKKVAMFEKLGQWMFEEIRAKICFFGGFDCDKSPGFISRHCEDNCDVCPAIIYRMSKRHHRPCNANDLEAILGKWDEDNVIL